MKIEVLKDLWVHLDQVTTLVRKARALEITHFHLSPPEAEILYILSHENRDLTFDEIARWNYRELNSVLIRINKMEKKGLVKKTRRAGTRKTTVRITEKGSSSYGAVASQSVHMIFEVITEEEQKQLESILTKLESRTRDLLGMGFKPPFLP